MNNENKVKNTIGEKMTDNIKNQCVNCVVSNLGNLLISIGNILVKEFSNKTDK